MNFEEFGFDKRILDAIKLQGYTQPTPIQQQAIPPALFGQDILGCAQTGTGKTCAFAVPILHNLVNASEKAEENASGKAKADEGASAVKNLENNQNDRFNKAGKARQNKNGGFAVKNKKPIRALILTPTRELAMQIDESFKNYGKFMPLSSGLIMGGVGQDSQVKMLSAGVDILTATPGRFIDLVGQGYINPEDIEIFVLDEADRMLDMGFFPDVKRIIAMLPNRSQTLFFSATMPSEVKKLTDTLLKNPAQVAVTPVSSTVDKIIQWVCLTDRVKKPELLVWVFGQLPEDSLVLIFTRTKHGADKLSHKLKMAGIMSKAIHGDKSQGARQDALSDFKKGKCRVLVATDIAARGLDIDDITHVINYELPNEPETYVHRIGRTGRAGKDGFAISFCDFDETKLLENIEKLIKKKIEVEDTQPYPMTVFVKTEKQPRPPRQKQAPRHYK